jgi:hypothetical protein
MKLAKLANGQFQMALTRLNSAPLPLRTAFKLKGLVSKVQTEYRKFEECRQAAISKYGKKDENGNVIIRADDTVEFEPDQLDIFAKELNELGQTDIELPTIKLDEIGDKAEISAEDLSLLEDILVE